MKAYTCPICGGKLNIRIGAEFALCSACGKPTDIDPDDAEKFFSIYRSAGREMAKKTAAGYREAVRELEAITFIEEAKEMSDECEARLRDLQARESQRQENEKISDKRDTVLGIIIAAAALLFGIAAIAGVIYVVVRMVNGNLPSQAIWVTLGAAAIAVVLMILNRAK